MTLSCYITKYSYFTPPTYLVKTNSYLYNTSWYVVVKEIQKNKKKPTTQQAQHPNWPLLSAEHRPGDWLRNEFDSHNPAASTEAQTVKGAAEEATDQGHLGVLSTNQEPH